MIEVLKYVTSVLNADVKNYIWLIFVESFDKETILIWKIISSPEREEMSPVRHTAVFGFNFVTPFIQEAAMCFLRSTLRQMFP
jgi:hypothetical protein